MRTDRSINILLFTLFGILFFIFLLYITQSFSQVYYTLLSSLKSVWDFGPNFLQHIK